MASPRGRLATRNGAPPRRRETQSHSERPPEQSCVYSRRLLSSRRRHKPPAQTSNFAIWREILPKLRWQRAEESGKPSRPRSRATRQRQAQRQAAEAETRSVSHFIRISACAWRAAASQERRVVMQPAERGRVCRRQVRAATRGHPGTRVGGNRVAAWSCLARSGLTTQHYSLFLLFIFRVCG